ncbi:hypothetical protein ZIOFF_005926 [Zingiber officinale]|uniref:Autophagy-related protein n=1 Tax=Zingiber officinale TaxID=94328 RepID=A0A8J5HRH7_ZINOF|nr:hypothetical protein ZIOFF_005926 [Zingiber officinale]
MEEEPPGGDGDGDVRMMANWKCGNGTDCHPSYGDMKLGFWRIGKSPRTCWIWMHYDSVTSLAEVMKIEEMQEVKVKTSPLEANGIIRVGVVVGNERQRRNHRWPPILALSAHDLRLKACSFNASKVKEEEIISQVDDRLPRCLGCNILKEVIFLFTENPRILSSLLLISLFANSLFFSAFEFSTFSLFARSFATLATSPPLTPRALPTLNSFIGQFAHMFTSAERRQAEVARIREKYPDRIPVIVEKAKRSDIPDIDKKKLVISNTCFLGF